MATFAAMATYMCVFLLFRTINLVTSYESLQIADQNAFIGKLFYYKIPISSLHNIKHISVSKAGDGQTLPDWLYFKKDSSELIGIPFEKGLHFIQVQIKNYGNQQWNDIFALEVSDGPQSGSSQSINQLTGYQCIIKIKQTFKNIADVWRVIIYLMPSGLTISDSNSHHFYEWLQKFSISRNSDDEYLIAFDAEKCDSNNLQIDGYDSQNEMRMKISKIGLDSDVVQISRKHLDDNELYSSVTQTHADSYLGKRNYHNRRHIADALNPTPVVGPDWMTLTTSTLYHSFVDSNSHLAEHDPLSRVLIPSMISPTMSVMASSSSLALIDKSGVDGHDHHRHHHASKYYTPFIYTTPVLSSERPTVIEGIDDLFTPVSISHTPTITPKIQSESTILIAPSPSVVPVVTSHIEAITPEEKPPTTSSEILEKPVTTYPAANKIPYINKRLQKKVLIAGKYWTYSIPSDTFVDYEDGDTRKLKLTFLMSSSSSVQEQPPTDYWIQFDNENQYLYALPTEDDVGKHIFNLVAVDSNGAHVNETLEFHVRQHTHTRAFTHMFTLSHIKWDTYQFARLIEAVSSIIERVTQIFGDSHDVVAIQKIVRNDKDSTWSVSWTNDSLPTHPCPRELIQDIYNKLRDPNKLIDDSTSEPSAVLRQAIAPEFRVQHIRLNYLAKSACGSIELPEPEGPRTKEKPIFRNRIGKLGTYRLGEAFRYRIPEDTVFSPARQVGTRELLLTLQAIQPPQFPNFLYFDTDSQELFGIALYADQVNTYEINLIAEDPINGAKENDVFTIEIVDEFANKSPQYTFEVTLNFISLNFDSSDLTIKEKVDIISSISTKMLRDGDASAVAIISIRRFEYEGLEPGIADDDNYLGVDPMDNELDSNKKQRYHRHHLEAAPKHRQQRDLNQQFYYEFKWTNRTIVGQDVCPKETIETNIINRIFKREYDSLKSLKDIFEPNYDLINVGFKPSGVCVNHFNLTEMGPRLIATTSPTIPAITSTKEPASKEDEGIENAIDIEDSNEFLLTTIIPPVAILIALIFAAIVGCCFHRANKRRKSVEISTRIPGDNGINEREAFLQKGRIPIIFEFEQQPQPQANPQSQPYNYTPVILPSSQPPPQQMTPLRQLSSTKPTYQPLSQQGPQQIRRQPPPYYK